MLTTLLLIVWLTADSQPPSPSPSVTSQEQKPTSTSKPNPTDPNSSTPQPVSARSTQPVTLQTQPIPASAGTQSQTEAFEDWRIVLFTGILTIVAVLQWIAMLRQSRHMREALNDSRADSAAAKIHMEAQLRMAVMSADAARKSADVAESAVALTRLQQRAWVGVETVRVSKTIAAGKPLMFDAVIVNSGSTPGKNCRAWIRMQTRDADLPFEFIGTTDDYGAIASRFTIMPRAKHISRAGYPSVSQAEIDAIRNEQVIIHIWGRIDYEDVFGKSHWATFYSYYSPEHHAPVAGTDHNNSDTEDNQG